MPNTTLIDRRSPSPGSTTTPRFYVVVLDRAGAIPFPLPAEGQLLIGRDPSADIVLVDPRASRSHARLIAGITVEIEDLASANGTRLREQVLEAGKRYVLEPGDVVMVGGTMLLLHPGDPVVDPSRVWAHEFLEGRLIEQCAIAQAANSSFALARIETHARAPAILVEQLIADVLRPGDVLALYAPGHYEALVVDVDREQAHRLRQAVIDAFARREIGATCEVAMFPADANSPQSLLGCVADRAEARAEAGDREDFIEARTDLAVAPVVAAPAVRQLYLLAERAAAHSSHVLIMGETGTGKELLAETVHKRSLRAAKPLIPVNCGALTDSLAESQLFGYERGAFTGAQQAKVGLVEAATGGTLFLDEIGETSLAVQAKLLRVIETGELWPVGATKPRPIDVRFVAATNRDLEEEVAEKRFREDLFYRLNVITLEIPPLRDRPEEIEILARHFLERLRQRHGQAPLAFSKEALELLNSYAWPGNVRELRNVIERASVLCAGSLITLEHLPAAKMRPRPHAAPSDEPAADRPPAAETSLARAGPDKLRDIERDAILRALERCKGNQSRAAELLGMPRRTLCKRMKQYNLPRPRS